MIRIKFNDNIINEYPIKVLKEIPFFKSLIESGVEINDIIPFSEFDSDIISDFIYNSKTVNFNKYKFDDLFHAKEFLMLYNKPHIQTQFTNQLKNLLLNDINKINLDRLEIYIRNEDKYILSDIINEKPDLIQLYPYVTSLRYTNKRNIDLTKFNNLNTLIDRCNDSLSGSLFFTTYRSFYNLKNLKELDCSDYDNLKDGCFDVFMNLEKLSCRYCPRLKKPFNNLKNLKELDCSNCQNLENGCFDTLISLETLKCENNTLGDDCFSKLTTLKNLRCNNCKLLKSPFNNLTNLKKLQCNDCTNLENNCFTTLTNLNILYCRDCHKLKNPFDNLKNLEILDCSNNYLDDCFDALDHLNTLDCSENRYLKNPFNGNLRNLKKLDCQHCGNLKDGVFDTLENLEELRCGCCKLINPFNKNLKNLKILECSYCYELKDGCFDIFEHLKELKCRDCSRFKKPFNINLNNLEILNCDNCYNLEDGCFDIFNCLNKLDVSNFVMFTGISHGEINNNIKFKKPFNINLKNLKELYCSHNINFEDGCFDVFENLDILDCEYNINLKKPFNVNLKNLKKIRCIGCKLEIDSFDVFTNLDILLPENRCYKKLKNRLPYEVVEKNDINSFNML